MHHGQKIPSHTGGTIQGIYHPENAADNRFSVVFIREESCVGIETHDGWGNEKKIDWQEL